MFNFLNVGAKGGEVDVGVLPATGKRKEAQKRPVVATKQGAGTPSTHHDKKSLKRAENGGRARRAAL